MHPHPHHHDASGRIAWAFGLNLVFTVIEFIGGWLTNSTAIMADAVHDLGDTLSIGTAWVLARCSGRQADSRFSYGYRRFSLLGALVNGLILVVGSLWVLSEAVPRLSAPEMPMVEGMLVLAVFGVLVNGLAAWKLSAGRTLNERVLNWHLLEDVLGWVAVLVVSVILWFVDWPILDPLLSIGFTLFILFNVLRHLVATLRLFLQAVPSPTLKGEIDQRLSALAGVAELHHSHLWSLDGEHHVLTAHLVLREALDAPGQVALKDAVRRQLQEFGLAHTTIEFEFPEESCRDS